MNQTFKVTRKFQITIPRKIREKFNIKEGDTVRIHDDGKRIILDLIVDQAKDPVEDMLSLFDKPVDVDVVKYVEESWDED